MLMSKRDAIEISLVTLAVIGTLAIGMVVIAVHIGAVQF